MERHMFQNKNSKKKYMLMKTINMDVLLVMMYGLVIMQQLWVVVL